MRHEMGLSELAFNTIKNGQQLIEVRLYDEKRRSVNLGDQIVFLKNPDREEQIFTEVIGLSIFKSFEELFKAIDKKKFGYKKEDTLSYQIECMRKYYSEDEEMKMGVVGIHIKVL